MSPRPTQPCGSRAAYSRGCRCAACAEANRRYNHAWRLGTPPAATIETLPAVALPGRWVDQAACRGLDPDLFFPTEPGLGKDPQTIKAICGSCVVRGDCLTWALQNNMRDGWFGGMSPKGRARIRSSVQ